MGEHHVEQQVDETKAHEFMRALLEDLRALAFMLQDGRVESGITRIGAEQEMFLIDRYFRPAPVSLEVLNHANDPRLTTEIARFNLEANLTPLEITDPQRRYEQTREWLTRYMMPAMSKISPGVGVGLLDWNWVEGRKGEYRLGYDSGVPEIVRSVLPKTTSRDFITCLAILQLRQHHSMAISDEGGGVSRTWIVAFPQEDFDLEAEAVFSTGARIVSDAWHGADPTPAVVSA